MLHYLVIISLSLNYLEPFIFQHGQTLASFDLFKEWTSAQLDHWFLE